MAQIHLRREFALTGEIAFYAAGVESKGDIGRTKPDEGGEQRDKACGGSLKLRGLDW